jgi:tryptophan synthase alpha chain
MSASRLEAVTARLAQAGECGIAPYVTAGDGGLGRTLAVLHALEGAGAACVELGLPFSDPVADGPLLQAAALRSLDSGTTFEGVLDLIARYRSAGGALPILAFSYANPILSRGAEDACSRLAGAGADGLLIPDLPVEEHTCIAGAMQAADLASVFFVTPTTADARIVRAAELSRGFLYVIGRTGITGARTELGSEGSEFLARVRSLTTCPLGVGFGINGPAEVAAVAPHAQLAIVGSALVEHIHQAALGSAPDQDIDAVCARAAANFVTHLREGLKP